MISCQPEINMHQIEIVGKSGTCECGKMGWNWQGNRIMCSGTVEPEITVNYVYYTEEA